MTTTGCLYRHLIRQVADALVKHGLLADQPIDPIAFGYASGFPQTTDMVIVNRAVALLIKERKAVREGLGTIRVTV